MVGAGQRLIPSFEVTVLLSAEGPGCRHPRGFPGRNYAKPDGVGYGTLVHLIILERSVYTEQ